jgi:putative DNA primase/helicase
MDTFTYQNQCSVFLATNHRPRVQGSDEAIWRRLQLIPFTYVMPQEDRKDPGEVQAILHSEQERNAILAWLVEGLRLWRKEGLKNTPPAILEATAAYRKDSDPMAEWLEDCVLVEDGAKVRIQAMRDSYTNHCQDAGRMPVGVTRFNAGLERLGAVRRAGRDEFNQVAKMWFGLRLKSGLTDT